MFTLRKSSVLLLTGVLLLSQSGCKKLLDLEPQDAISDASYWRTPNDFMLAANTFYTYERTFNQVLYDVVPNQTFQNLAVQNYHSDFKADFVSGQNTYSRGLNTLQPTDYNYNNNYSRIRTINYLLDRASTYATPGDIKKYVAEAKFFRAYVYFDLLQTYGGVPIVDKLLALEAQELQQPQKSREEVADFIIQDLDAALVDLPLKSAQSATTEQGRINRETAYAFLGRVALYEGTWQKFRGNTSRGNTLLDRAISANNSVITGAQYQLFAPAVLGDSAQKYLFTLENQKSNPANVTKTANNEYILANRYDQTIRQVRNNISRQANQVGVTHAFANQFLCRDGLPIDKSPLFRGYGTTTAEYANRDSRMRYTMKVPGQTYWYSGGNARVNWTGDATDRATGVKFVPNGGSGYSNQKWVAERAVTDNEEGYDYPVIRYAEVLLNYAEAVYERNGAITDGDLDKSFNLVRNRVNKTMPKLSNAFASANGLDLRTEIRRERNIELFLEGFRLDDLKRWNIADQELRKALVGIRWQAGTDYATAWPTAASLPKDANGSIIVDAAGNRQFGSKNYLLPLPTQQLQLNPQLQQNTGW